VKVFHLSQEEIDGTREDRQREIGSKRRWSLIRPNGVKIGKGLDLAMREKAR
jgi:hypothetical protein